jgi:hypothetical protein
MAQIYRARLRCTPTENALDEYIVNPCCQNSKVSHGCIQSVDCLSNILRSASWSEQQMIEFHAPEYLGNVVRIITETGLRVYKELATMKKDQVDLEDATV